MGKKEWLELFDRDQDLESLVGALTLSSGSVDWNEFRYTVKMLGGFLWTLTSGW